MAFAPQATWRNGLGAAGAKEVAPYAMRSTILLFVLLTLFYIYVCYVGLCVPLWVYVFSIFLWIQQSYISVLHLHLWWFYLVHILCQFIPFAFNATLSNSRKGVSLELGRASSELKFVNIWWRKASGCILICQSCSHSRMLWPKQEHKVSYRCSLPSPLQKRSKVSKELHWCLDAAEDLLGLSAPHAWAWGDLQRIWVHVGPKEVLHWVLAPM